MRTKAAFLTGAAVGYVLGARAGRERYDQIARTARRYWEDPRVQEKVGDVQEQVTQTAGDLQGKLTQTAQDLASTAKDKASSAGSGGGTGGGTDEVTLTTYDSATGTMETTTIEVPDAQAGSNGRP
ncbi:YtxH domain-containing protein [Vallicoccus soli]|uniref:YtxH domain-containing protein n=1 Tax=Vallicoccus soli TaxID=2339232 RepID=UPI001401ECBF|nr:YtxH domain-containing protein [Vallicoccus soli]